MVFFICNACGESLKKSKVANHTSFKACSTKFVSCMDCNKEFYGDDYSTHNTCITEDQKYGGKDYVPKEMKGKNKQIDFVEKLRKILSEIKDVDPQLQAACEMICTHDNVPRKEKKFTNFCNNVHIKPYLISAVWQLVHKATQETSNTSTETASKRPLEEEEKTPKEGEEMPRKKKKKNKKSDSEEVSQNLQEDNTNEATVQSPKKKKAKKEKRDKELSNANDGEDTDSKVVEKQAKDKAGDKEDMNAEDDIQSKKKKKKSKKSDSPKETSESQETESAKEALKCKENDLEEKEEENSGGAKLSKKEKKRRKLESQGDDTAAPVQAGHPKKKNKENLEGNALSNEATESIHTKLTNGDAQHGNEPSQMNGGLQDYQMRKKKNKRSHRTENEETTDNLLDTPQEEPKVNKKQKKKNRDRVLAEKDDNAVEMEEVVPQKNKEKNSGRLNDTLVEDEGHSGSFSWKMSIKKILKNGPEEGLKLKKLEKLVMSDYYDHEGLRAILSINEVKATLKKKLHGDKYVVLKDHVKLR